MKRIVTILTFLVVLATSARATWYYSINIDYKTIAAMTEAYAANALIENNVRQHTENIFEHYKAAGVSAAGILAYNYEKNRALRKLGLWDSQENYYYKRIYKLVAQRILPKIVRVTGQLLKKPEGMIYWGGYILKTCNDVKALCTQFESIVTNGNLSFKSIDFLEVTPELKAVFSLQFPGVSEQGFQSYIDNFTRIGEGLTKEQLAEDFENLKKIGASLAMSGVNSIAQDIVSKNSIQSIIANKKVEFDQSFKSTMGNSLEAAKAEGLHYLKDKFGGALDVSQVFTTSRIDLSLWQNNTEDGDLEKYFTEHGYIYSEESGSEVVCRFTPQPSITKDNVRNHSQVYHCSATSQSGPTTEQYQAARERAYTLSGWSPEKCRQLNSANPGHTYRISTSATNGSIWKTSVNGKITEYHIPYDVTVTHSWHIVNRVYEDDFDSSKQDYEQWKKKLEAICSDYNRNPQMVTGANGKPIEGQQLVYKVGYENRRTYTVTPDYKLKGVDKATINVTCKDNAEIAKYGTTYTCWRCVRHGIQHRFDCAMWTNGDSPAEKAANLAEIQDYRKEKEQEYNDLLAEKSQYTAEMNKLKGLIARCDPKDIINLRILKQKYSEYEAKLADVEKRLDTLKAELEEIKQQEQQAIENAQRSDPNDQKRIPWLLNEFASKLHIIWNNDAHWEGDYYKITGTLSGKPVRASVKVTVEDNGKKVFGWSWFILRDARIGLEMTLEGDLTTTNVFREFTFTSSTGEKEKAEQIRAAEQEAREMFPTCNISTSYETTNVDQKDPLDDTNHLLWSANRLEIARDVYHRLVKIYTDLVCLEKYLHYSNPGWLGILKNALPPIDMEAGKKRNIAERSQRRWMHNAAQQWPNYDNRYAETEDDNSQ